MQHRTIMIYLYNNQVVYIHKSGRNYTTGHKRWVKTLPPNSELATIIDTCTRLMLGMYPYQTIDEKNVFNTTFVDAILKYRPRLQHEFLVDDEPEEE